ncbi:MULTISPECIES: hypothetical protein [unclassified Desulfovibrio]|uniref:hypothetical protein n=1 Tax=unclassified Desulfovibrio TaxID=2593640 RepID=UPI002FDA10B5
MKELYKSDVSAAIHETAQGLYEHDIIDEKSMHEFDKTCLASSPLDEKGVISHCIADEDRSQQFAANRGQCKVSD